ncbi:MAG: 2TM domain-containing protein [Aggregatilineales bacterium]
MDDQQYRAIRKAAEKRVKSRIEFYEHLAAYVMVNAMLILAFGFPFWMIFVTFGWGAGLITHGIQVFLDDPSRRERAIVREMERLGYTPSEQEKPKRSRVKLADDGELVYEDEADAYDAEEVPRRRRDY